jgi:predicted dehydrogenase
MPARPARLGLIGAGAWGRNYIKTIAGLPGEATLSMVASRNPETHSLVPAGCPVFEDWRRVATAGGLDGVIVATPPALHVEMAEAAVLAGLPVLVEKPLSRSVADAERFLRVAADRHASVMMDHIHLFSPAYRALKAAGIRLGRIQWIQAKAGRPAPAHFDDPVLWEWGCHDAAMCLDLVGGTPEEAKAVRLGRRVIQGRPAEQVGIHLRFPGDVPADIDVGNLVEKKQRVFAVQFETELWVYDDFSPDKLKRYPGVHDRATRPAGGLAVPVPSEPPLTVAVREFARMTAEKRAGDLASLDLGVKVVHLLARCERSLA